jgi:ribose 1,5-bisphosphokinase
VRASARIGPGLVVLIMGPSGAGKDSVLGAVERRLAQARGVAFPRRIVTRPPNPAEDHVCVSPEEFDALARDGALALSWSAHGLRYAIAAANDAAVRAGRCVVFNASRGALKAARERYANVAAVLIDAPLELRAQRLAARGREPAVEIALRLARRAEVGHANAELVIANDGELAVAADALTAWLMARCGMPALTC